MSSVLLSGPKDWSKETDDEGNAVYTITVKAKTDDPAHGPNYVENFTVGLPLAGDIWNWETALDVNVWRTRYIKVEPEVQGEANTDWRITLKYSSVTPTRCQDDEVGDPLLEPQKVSGSFTKYQVEASRDLGGRLILSSSGEPLTGPQVEFDENRPQVRIEQNVPLLQLGLFASLVDKVNISPLWGLPARTIKLSNVGWERKFHGSCNVYYTRILEFDINFNTFDRSLRDVGRKCLNGRWGNTANGDPTEGWILVPTGRTTTGLDPDPRNPSHMMNAIDRQGNETTVVLDGRGKPYNPNRVDTCFEGTREAAIAEATRIGASLVIGPYNSNICLSGHNLYTPLGQDWWWCIGQIHPNEDDNEYECFNGTEEEAQLRAYETPLSDEVIDTSIEGPFVNEAACEIYCFGSDASAWWNLQNPPGQPGFRFVAKYPGANFLVLGIPTTF